MIKHLENIENKSPAYKKRFALLVSGGITLSIFTFWSLFTFSLFKGNETVAQDNVPKYSNTASAITPLNSLSSGVAGSLKILKDQFNAVKGSIKSIDINTEYDKMRSDAVNSLPTYSGGSNDINTNYGN